MRRLMLSLVTVMACASPAQAQQPYYRPPPPPNYAQPNNWAGTLGGQFVVGLGFVAAANIINRLQNDAYYGGGGGGYYTSPPVIVQQVPQGVGICHYVPQDTRRDGSTVWVAHCRN